MEAQVSIAGDMVRAHPGDAARMLLGMSPADAARVLSRLGPDVSSLILPRLAVPFSAACMGALSAADAGAVLDVLPVSIGAGLVRNLPAAARAAVLEHTRRRGQIEAILEYPSMSVGAIMDTRMPAVPLDASSDQALEAVADLQLRSLPYLYVTDVDGVLVGVLESEELDRPGNSGRSISELIHAPVVSLKAESPIRSVMDHPAWFGHDVLPVTGRGDRLVGILRHRELRRFGQAVSITGAGDTVGDILLPLGELYWLNMWKIVDAVVSGPGRVSGTSSETGSE